MREQELLERLDELLLRPVILEEIGEDNYWAEFFRSTKEPREKGIIRAGFTVFGAIIHLPFHVAAAIYKAAVDHYGELPFSLSEMRRKAGK